MAPLLKLNSNLVGCVLLAFMARLCTADIIAYHAMNTTDQWNFTTTEIPTILTVANNASSVCPQNEAYCWQITNRLDARLVIPTSDYFRIISFVFSASIVDMNRSDTFSVQYALSTDPSTWHGIAFYDNTTNTPFTATTTFTNWPQASFQLNASDITIRILSTGNEHRCYLNDFTLNGYPKSLLSASVITDSRFVANESYKYWNDTLVCIDSMDCSLRCSSSATIQDSCTDTTLHCPSDNGTACSIVCDRYDSCSQLAIDIRYNNTALLQSRVECDSSSECRGKEIVCPPHAPCDIVCSGDSSCENALILCPEHAPCDISCTARNSCDGSTIHCPIDAECTIHCLGEYGCYYPTIIWPAIPELSSLTCANGNLYACWGVAFPPVAPNTSLSVDCTGWGTCWEAIIQCPSNAVCDVNCASTSISGAVECGWGTILWPSTPGLGSLHCDGAGYDGCRWLMFPTPDPDVPLSIRCTGSEACANSFIKCPSNANCSVHCVDWRTCSGATILWPTNPDANTELECIGSDACDGTTPLPTFYTSPDEETDLVLDCSARSECAGFVVDCPLNASCIISCQNAFACQGMQIFWADGQENDLQCGAGYESVCSGVHFQPYDQNAPFSHACSGDDACNGAIFDCPSNADCVIECVDECRHATIHGPIDHVLTVVCHPGWRNCHGLTIYAEESSFFTLNATGEDSLAGATVFLPPNDQGTPRTVMKINPGGTNHLNTFYARNGWKDANFVYPSGWDWSAAVATMHCGDAYQKTCSIAMDGADGLSCRAGFEVCRFLTSDPTEEPTPDPTETPTADPTEPPTADPTETPTADPSHPTEPPTADPSVYSWISTTALESTIYTISIRLNECSQTSCDIEQDVMDRIDAIIVAYLDADAVILKGDIIDNKIEIVIAAARSVVLDKDLISQEIKNELGDLYGDDIDVEIEEESEETPEEETPEEEIPEDVIRGAIIGGMVYIAIMISYGVCVYRKKKKHAKTQHDMVAAAAQKSQIRTFRKRTDSTADNDGQSLEPGAVEEHCDDSESESENDNDSLYDKGDEAPNAPSLETDAVTTTQKHGGDINVESSDKSESGDDALYGPGDEALDGEKITTGGHVTTTGGHVTTTDGHVTTTGGHVTTTGGGDTCDTGGDTVGV